MSTNYDEIIKRARQRAAEITQQVREKNANNPASIPRITQGSGTASIQRITAGKGSSSISRITEGSGSTQSQVNINYQVDLPKADNTPTYADMLQNPNAYKKTPTLADDLWNAATISVNNTITNAQAALLQLGRPATSEEVARNSKQTQIYNPTLGEWIDTGVEVPSNLTPQQQAKRNATIDSRVAIYDDKAKKIIQNSDSYKESRALRNNYSDGVQNATFQLSKVNTGSFIDDMVQSGKIIANNPRVAFTTATESILPIAVGTVATGITKNPTIGMTLAGAGGYVNEYGGQIVESVTNRGQLLNSSESTLASSDALASTALGMAGGRGTVDNLITQAGKNKVTNSLSQKAVGLVKNNVIDGILEGLSEIPTAMSSNYINNKEVTNRLGVDFTLGMAAGMATNSPTAAYEATKIVGQGLVQGINKSKSLYQDKLTNNPNSKFYNPAVAHNDSLSKIGNATDDASYTEAMTDYGKSFAVNLESLKNVEPKKKGERLRQLSDVVLQDEQWINTLSENTPAISSTDYISSLSSAYAARDKLLQEIQDNVSNAGYDITTTTIQDSQSTLPSQSQIDNNSLYVGDSIAKGYNSNSKYATNGHNPAQVLKTLKSMGDINGKTVVLSTGLSNNTNDTKNVIAQFDYLKNAGANVLVLGMVDNYKDDSNLASQLNSFLTQKAKEYGFGFKSIGSYAKTDKYKAHPDITASAITQSDIAYGKPKQVNNTSNGFTGAVAVMGVRSKGDTGNGSGEMYHIQANGGSVNPTSYLDRFTVGGKSLKEFNTSKEGSWGKQRLNSDGSTRNHKGLDFSINESFGSDSKYRTMYIAPNWQNRIKSISKGADGTTGGYTSITFDDGVRITIGHQNVSDTDNIINGYNSYRQSNKGATNNTTTQVQNAPSAFKSSMSAGTINSKIKLPNNTNYDNLFVQYGKAAGFSDVEIIITKAIVSGESGFNPNIQSPKGALGLAQFMPATGKQYGVTDRTSPEQSIQGMYKFLNDMRKKFGGDWAKMLAGYNAGQNHKRIPKGQPADGWVNNSGLPSETRNYVHKILSNVYNGTITLNGKSYKDYATGTQSSATTDGMTVISSVAFDEQTQKSIGAMQATLDKLNDLEVQKQQAKEQAEKDVIDEQITTLQSKITELEIINQQQAQLYEDYKKSAYVEALVNKTTSDEINKNEQLKPEDRESLASIAKSRNILINNVNKYRAMLAQEEGRVADNDDTADTGNPVKQDSELVAKQVAPLEGLKSTVQNSSITMEDIEALNSQGILADSQLKSLRRLSDFNRQLAESSTIDNVANTILYGRRKQNSSENDMLGLDNYNQRLTDSLINADVQGLSRNLRNLNRWRDNQVAKANAINQWIDESSMDNPITLVATQDGQWLRSQELQAEQIAKVGKGDKITLKGNQSRYLAEQINKEADYLSAFSDNWNAVVGEFFDGNIQSILNKPQGIRDNLQATQKLYDASNQSADTNTPASVQTSNTASTSENTTPNKPVQIDGINYISHDSRNNLDDNSRYIGRGQDKAGNIFTLSGVNSKEQVGRDGWLGMPYNIGAKGAYGVDNKVQAAQKYLKLLQKKATTIEGFIDGLVALRDKTLYGDMRGKSNQIGDVNLIGQIVSKLPSDVNQAQDYLNNISIDDEGNISLPKVAPSTSQNISADAKANPDTLYITNDNVRKDDRKYSNTDNVIGFDLVGKNKDGFDIINDTSNRANVEAKIKKTIATIKKAYDDGRKVVVDSEGIATHLQSSSPELYKIITDGLNEAIGYVPPKQVADNNRQSSYQSKAKTTGEKAQRSVTTAGRKDNSIDLTQKPAIATKEVTKHEQNKEGESISYTYEEKVHKDPTSDELTITDLTDIAVTLEDNFDDVITALSQNDKGYEAKVAKTLIEDLLAYNSDIKLKVVTNLNKTSYDEKSNTISISTAIDRPLLDQLAVTLTGVINQQLPELLLDSNNPKVIQINQELDEILAELSDVNITDYTSDKDTTVLFTHMIKDKTNLVKYGLADRRMVEILSQIRSKSNETKQSLYNRMLTAVAKFLGFGKKVTTLYSRLIQAQDNILNLQYATDVDYTASKDNTVYGLDKDESGANILEYWNVNWLSYGFTQVKSKNKPLTQINQLASKLKVDMAGGLNVLNLTATASQRKQLRHFLSFKDEFAPHIRQTFSTRTATTQYQDMKGYMVDDEGQLSENTITALAYVAYNHILVEGGSLYNKEADLKKLLNVAEEDPLQADKQIWDTYKFIGKLHTNTALDMGQDILGTLGLVSNDNISAAMASRLQASLGDWLISAMQSADIIHINKLSSKQHQENIKQVGGDANYQIADEGEVSFVSFSNSEGKGVNESLIEEIKQHSKTTQGFISQVFNQDTGLKYPSFKPIDKVKQKIKRADYKVGKNQEALVAKMQQEAIRLDEDTTDTFVELYKHHQEFLLDLVGARVSEETLQATHDSEVESVLSRADGLKRELELALDFVSGVPKYKGEYVPFYDSIFVARNTRMHYNSNVFNIQSSNVARAMGYLQSQKHTFKADELGWSIDKFLDNKGKTTALGNFIKGIAETAEGVEGIIENKIQNNPATKDKYHRGFTADKVQDKDFIPAFIDYLQTDTDVQQAIKAVHNMLDNPKQLSKEDKQAIQKVVMAWKGEAKSVRALIELAKFSKAIDEGVNFTTSKSVSSDGINNGSALAMLLYGLLNNPIMLARFGILTKQIAEEENYTDYMDTRVNSLIGDFYTAFGSYLTDSFETVAAKVTKNMPADKAKSYYASQQAMIRISPSLNKRTVLKALLIPFGYNAGLESLVRAASNTAIGDIKASLMEFYNTQRQLDNELNTQQISKQEYQDKLDNLRSDITRFNNDLISFVGFGLANDKGLLDIYSFKSFWFTKKQEAELRQAFASKLKPVINNALNEYQGELIEARRDTMQAHNTAGVVADTLSKKLEEKLINELREKVTKYVNDNLDSIKQRIDKQQLSENQREQKLQEAIQRQIDRTVEIIGISQKQYQEEITDVLKNSKMSIATSMEFDGDYDNDQNSIPLYKEKQITTASVALNSQTKVVNSKGEYVLSNKQLAEKKQGYENAGIFPSSAQIQGTDATIAATVNGGEITHLNIHDSIEGNSSTIRQGAIAQNKATVDAVLNYDMGTINATAMINALQLLVDNHQDNIIDTDNAVLALAEILKNKGLPYQSARSLANFSQELIATTKDKLINNDINKLTNFDKIAYMHQYGYEGGAYAIRPDDLVKAKQIKQRIINQQDKLTKQLDNIIKQLPIGFSPKEVTGKAPSNIGSKLIANSIDRQWFDVGRQFGANYTNNDTLFVDINSNKNKRSDKFDLLATLALKELELATQAQVKSITLAEGNVEQQVVAILLNNGYMPKANNSHVWTYVQKPNLNRQVKSANDIRITSGLAIGADQLWGMIAHQAGFVNQVHFKPSININDKLVEGTEYSQVKVIPKDKVAQAINAVNLLQNITDANYLSVHNLYQKLYSDTLLVVGSMQDIQENRTSLYGDIPMAKALGKSVYVYDPDTNLWYQSINDSWQVVAEDTIRLSTNTALVGTRALEKMPKRVLVQTQQAMQAVMQRTHEWIDGNQNTSINIWSTEQNGYQDLSNLVKRPFNYQGVNYTSVEHAYQTLKSGEFHKPTYDNFSKQSLAQIKKQALKANSNTNVSLMRQLIQASFDQNDKAREKLIATQGKQLTHTQAKDVWADKFPELLMQVRESYLTTNNVQNIAATDLIQESLFDNTPENTTLDSHLGFVQNSLANVQNNSSYTEQSKQAADYLQQNLQIWTKLLNSVNPEVGFVTKPSNTMGIDDLGRQATAQYDMDSNTITLADELLRSNNPLNIAAKTVHEIIHAATVGSLTNAINSNNTKVVKSAEYLEDVRTLVEAYAITNADNTLAVQSQSLPEFVAYLYSDLTFTKKVLEIMEDNEVQITVTSERGILTKARQLLNKLANWVANLFDGDKQTKDDFNSLTEATMTIIEQGDYNKATGIFNSSVDVNPQAEAEATRQINAIDVKQLYGSLDKGNISDETNNRLDDIIDKVISINYKQNPSFQGKVDKSQGKPNSNVLQAGFVMSDKQVAVYEAVYELVQGYKESVKGTLPLQELNAMYDKLRSSMSIDNFLVDKQTATDVDRQIATSQYDFLFSGDKNQVDKQLARFVALAITHEGFAELLNKQDISKQTEETGTWFDWVIRMVDKVINFFKDRYLDSKNATNDARVAQAFYKLNQLESQLRNREVDKMTGVYDKFVGVVGLADTIVKKVAGKATQTAVDKLSEKSQTVSELNKLNKSIKNINEKSGGKIGFSDVIQDMFDTINSGKARQGIIAETFTETRAYKGMRAVIERLTRITQNMAQERQNAKDSLKKQLAEKFGHVDKRVRSNITNKVLRTDVSSLFAQYEPEQILRLLSNKEYLRQEQLAQRALVKNQIANSNIGNAITNRARILGGHMVAQHSPEHLLKNPKTIISYYYENNTNLPNSLEENVDVLVTLEALSFTNITEDTGIQEVIRNQADDVIDLLTVHRTLVEKSKEDFKDNPYSYEKGYLPDITNPLRSLKWVDSEEEREKLLSEGWVDVQNRTLLQDPADNTPARWQMLHTDAGYSRRTSGALDLKDTSARGTVVYNEFDSPKELRRVVLQKAKEAKKLESITDPDSIDVFATSGQLVSAYNPDGSITNVHYEMTGAAKNSYLERDNDFLEVLPDMYANSIYNPLIKEQQRAVAIYISKDVEEEYLKNPKAFVVLDPNSTDPQIREMYRLLPYEFKAQYKALNGNKPIIIRREIVNMTFGFSQYSLAKLWDKKPNELNWFEKALKNIFDILISPQRRNAKYKIISTERAIQMVMRAIKDFIVIRTPAVLIGNIIANSLMLLLEGLSPVQIAKSYTKAWIQGKEYKQLNKRLSDTKAKLLSNPNDKKLQGEVNYLQNRLQNHAMHEYMVNGFMSTIVDDVQLVDNQSQFGSLLEEKLITAYEKNVPKPVQTVIDVLTMSSKTKLHKFMSEATQFSDFSAKVALMEHRRSKGMSFDEAAAEAQSIFLNFDVPQHMAFQYLDRMGLFMFMKFFIRFQGVLTRAIGKKPASILLLQLMSMQLGMIGILDPFILFRLGNPFSGSVFNLFDAFKGIAGIALIGRILF